MPTEIQGLATPRSQTSPQPASQSLDKSSFMDLLMAQLANQDPTAPMDAQAFVAQLAQFATLELLQSANDGLDAILMAQAASNQTAVATFVGRTVAYRSDRVDLDGAGPVASRGRLAAPADSVTVRITDEDGKVVRTLRLGAQSEGRLEVSWDGRDDAGDPLPPGSYHVEIVAEDASGSVDAYAVREAVVDGVSYESGHPELLVGTERIPLADVLEVRAT
jgi:flagellar basal-body rod modification protein FlgD